MITIRRAVQPGHAARSLAVEFVLLVIIVALWGSEKRGLLALAVFVRQAIVVARIYLNTGSGRRRLQKLLGEPAKLLALSFLSIIVIGTIFLTFPRSTTDKQGAEFTDAVFTATSATCVTGLAVLNTNNDPASNSGLQSFSSFGQLVIIILIQVGGLGIMTLSAAVVMLLGRRLGMRSEAVLRTVMEEDSRRDIERSIRYIFRMTLVAETLGATILFFRFWTHLGDVKTAAYHAIFHSISAYCNAGFALFGNSLVSFQGDTVTLITIMVLITIGGLGPIVVGALCRWENLKRAPSDTWRQLSVHVKLVILVSATLVVGGTVIFYFFESTHSLKELPLFERLTSALFQSVTMRTAGFNTVDLSEMHRVTFIAVIIMMAIGGSSGSTAGGVKTSTIAVVLMGVRAMVQGRDEVEVGGRTIPKGVVYKAISILVIFMTTLVLGFTMLLILEPNHGFEALLFESVSALATVGVSMGITPKLTLGGKWLITFLMFVGRIGPLTMALAVGERSDHVALHYPEGKIMVG